MRASFNGAKPRQAEGIGQLMHTTAGYSDEALIACKFGASSVPQNAFYGLQLHARSDGGLGVSVALVASAARGQRRIQR